MSKPTLAATPPQRQDLAALLEELETPEMHPVAIALSKASAAHWLLEELDTGALGERTEEEADTKGWLQELALRELTETIETARAEFVKVAELLKAAGPEELGRSRAKLVAARKESDAALQKVRKEVADREAAPPPRGRS
jgi:hypothetical protein